MKHITFLIILSATGVFGGLSWSLFTSLCFQVVRRILGYDEKNSRPISLTDLVGYIIGVVVSCGFMLAVILLVVSWTNKYPEWRSSKYVFWLGLIAGVGLLQMIRKRKN